MTSNRVGQFSVFLDRLEKSLADPSSVEVLVKIDDHDIEMGRLMKVEKGRRRVCIKYISTPLPGGFFGLWRSYNDLLKISDPNTYFFLNLNDEMYFSTEGWDAKISGYIGLFEDNIFRLRTSNQKYRNYIDPWECGFAPDNAAFITRRWIEIGGDWTPCTGPETFQQLVAYYMAFGDRFSIDRPHRDIAVEGIIVKGEGDSIGLTEKQKRLRQRRAIPEWKILMSSRVRTEAFRRAAKLAATIYAHRIGIKEAVLVDNWLRKRIEIIDASGSTKKRYFSYYLNPITIRIQNILRTRNYGYFGGAGEDLGKSLIRNWLGYLATRYTIFQKLYFFAKKT